MSAIKVPLDDNTIALKPNSLHFFIVSKPITGRSKLKFCFDLGIFIKIGPNSLF